MHFGIKFDSLKKWVPFEMPLLRLVVRLWNQFLQKPEDNNPQRLKQFFRSPFVSDLNF